MKFNLVHVLNGKTFSFPFHLGSIIDCIIGNIVGNIIGIFTIYQMIERINCSVERVCYSYMKWN